MKKWLHPWVSNLWHNKDQEIITCNHLQSFAVIINLLGRILFYCTSHPTALRAMLTYDDTRDQWTICCIPQYWKKRRWDLVTPPFIDDNSLQKNQTVTSEKLSSSVIRILIVDDDPDITFTFKKGLEAENEKNSSSNKVLFKVKS